MNLPHYRCHKEVGAVRIVDIKYHPDNSATIYPYESWVQPFGVSREFVMKHDPQVGGYFVEYADGYQSFSPSTAFEDGYTEA
jgi:hypothetical protein